MLSALCGGPPISENYQVTNAPTDKGVLFQLGCSMGSCAKSGGKVASLANLVKHNCAHGTYHGLQKIRSNSVTIFNRVSRLVPGPVHPPITVLAQFPVAAFDFNILAGDWGIGQLPARATLALPDVAAPHHHRDRACNLLPSVHAFASCVFGLETCALFQKIQHYTRAARYHVCPGVLYLMLDIDMCIFCKGFCIQTVVSLPWS